MSLSVLIPTYNRHDMLGDVLAGLAQQQADPSSFEVVVIDDGSSDGTAEAVRAHQGGKVRIKYVFQENAGLNVARNRAAAEAAYDLLVYLDDDVLLPPAYVGQMGAAFELHPEAAAVAGRILLRFEAPKPPWLSDNLRLYLSEYDRGDNVEMLNPPEYPRGASFGIRRSCLDALGGFAPALDRRGTSLISSGEQELFMRLFARGDRIVYWPAARVEHRVPAERVTLGYFRRRAAAQGASDALIERAQRRPATLLREVVRAARIVPIAAKGLGHPAGRVNTSLWWEYCRGRLQATWRAQP